MGPPGTAKESRSGGIDRRGRPLHGDRHAAWLGKGLTAGGATFLLGIPMLDVDTPHGTAAFLITVFALLGLSLLRMALSPRSATPHQERLGAWAGAAGVFVVVAAVVMAYAVVAENMWTDDDPETRDGAPHALGGPCNPLGVPEANATREGAPESPGPRPLDENASTAPGA